MRHSLLWIFLFLSSASRASGGFRCEWTADIESAKLVRTDDALYDEQAKMFVFRIKFKAGSAARTKKACKGTDMQKSRIKVRPEAEFEIETRKRPDLPAGARILFDVLYTDGVGGNGVVTSDTYELKKLQ